MIIDETRWLDWGQPSCVHHIYVPLEAGMLDLKQFFGHSWPLTILYFEQDRVHWINRWEELRSLGEKFIDTLLMPGYSNFFYRIKKPPTSYAGGFVECKVTLELN